MAQRGEEVNVAPAGVTEFLKFIRRGGSVRRFHTVPTLHENSVAEHSFGVAWLLYLLTGGSPSAELLLAGLSHDLAEQVTGDIPGPAKRLFGLRGTFSDIEKNILDGQDLWTNAAGLSEADSRILKMADCMDGMLYCWEERRYGNKNVDEAFHNYSAYVSDLAPYDLEQHVFQVILELYRKEEE